jgi:hypothetical protein
MSIGFLECDCGKRFFAPLRPKNSDVVVCPDCRQVYSGQEESCGPGCWKKEGEGWLEMCSELRAILDSDNKNHWGKAELLDEVKRLVLAVEGR